MRGNLLSLMFLPLALLMLPLVQASASLEHDHGTVSPFDKQKHKHKLFCELHKHHLSIIYCPHGITEKNKEKLTIALDCGGKNSGTLPAFGTHADNDFSFNTTFSTIELVLINQRFASLSSTTEFFLPDRIDHPPQTV